MNSNFLLLFLIFNSVSVIAQDSFNDQIWIWQKKTDCNGNKKDTKDSSKWNVEFRKDYKAIISKNKSDLKGESNYSLDDKEIVMNGTHYEFHMKGSDSLVLDLKNCEKLLFISKRSLLENQRKTFFKHQGDTIYFSTDFNAPKLQGYPNYMKYMTIKLPGPDHMEGPCLIKLQFIVRSNGVLTDSRGSISCHRKAEKSIEKLMKQMIGQWEPMYINNKPVSTLMRININYSGTVIDAKDLN